MKDLYIPHLQRHCSPLLTTQKPEWDRLDLSDFLQVVMEIGDVRTSNRHRDAICLAVSDMCEEDPAIAEIFLEDSFTRLGFKFAGGLCEKYGLSISGQFMIDNLGLLQANMDSYDHEKTQFPQRIWTSNIFAHAGIAGIKAPTINPLFLKMLLSAKGEEHQASILTYFGARPINMAIGQLLTLVKGLDKSISSNLVSNQDEPDWTDFMAGLSELDDAGMIDPAKVVQSFRDTPWYAGNHTPMILALYDDAYSGDMLPVMVMGDLPLEKPLPKTDGSHPLKVKALQKIIKHHRGGRQEGVELALKAVIGGSEDHKPESTSHYAHLAHAALKIVSESKELAEHVFSEINIEIGKTSVVRARRPVLASIMFQGEGGEPPLYRDFLGQSSRLDELLGDLAANMFTNKLNHDLIGLDAAQHLLDAGALGLKHIKKIVGITTGREFCAGLRLPDGMLEKLPVKFRDTKLGSDLGL